MTDSSPKKRLPLRLSIQGVVSGAFATKGQYRDILLLELITTQQQL